MGEGHRAEVGWAVLVGASGAGPGEHAWRVSLAATRPPDAGLLGLLARERTTDAATSLATVDKSSALFSSRVGLSSHVMTSSLVEAL